MGIGSKIMAYVVRNNIGWTLAATWEGGFVEERALKLQKNGPRHCPICRQQKLLQKMGL